MIHSANAVKVENVDKNGLYDAIGPILGPGRMNANPLESTPSLVFHPVPRSNFTLEQVEEIREKKKTYVGTGKAVEPSRFKIARVLKST